jgi:predicted NBD/HSP70 family sugar kinase
MSVDALTTPSDEQVRTYDVTVDRVEARFAAALAQKCAAVDQKIAELVVAIETLQQALDPEELLTVAREIGAARDTDVARRLARELATAADHRGGLEDVIVKSLCETGVLTERTQKNRETVGVLGSVATWARTWTSGLITQARQRRAMLITANHPN